MPWLLNHKKGSFQNFNLKLSNFFQHFTNQTSHNQTPLKLAFLISSFVFMKIRKLESVHRENKKHDLHKSDVFSLWKPFIILWG